MAEFESAILKPGGIVFPDPAGRGDRDIYDAKEHQLMVERQSPVILVFRHLCGLGPNVLWLASPSSRAASASPLAPTLQPLSDKAKR